MINCFICGKEVVVDDDNSLVGTQDNGKTYVSMHVSCGNEKNLDVCGVCMKVVSNLDIVDNVYHTCSNCVYKINLLKGEN